MEVVGVEALADLSMGTRSLVEGHNSVEGARKFHGGQRGKVVYFSVLVLLTLDQFGACMIPS